MNEKRAREIFNNFELTEIYYNDNPVWIQEINNNTARIGFLNGFPDKDVFIEDLYE